MAQRGELPSLRVTVPTLGKSPSLRLSKYHFAFSPSPTPSPVIYQRPHNGRLWIAILLQLSSLYAVHQWLIRSQQQAQQVSVIKFAFLAFFGTSFVLGFLQRPWKGRAISSSQWLILFISGALLALSFFLRLRGLADVGPLETILAEYAGAVVGKVLIKAQRKVHGTGNAKIRGAIAILAGLFLLSRGWAVSPCSPLSSLLVPATKTRKFATARLTRATRISSTSESRVYLEGEVGRSQMEEDCAKYMHVLAPVFAGLLSSMQRLLPSSTSLVNVPRKRLQALTYLTAGAAFVPIALVQLAFMNGGANSGLDQKVLWPLFSMISFGMVVAFYGEFFSEEKLLISPLSPFHFFVTVCSVCILELTYGSNFSLLGFVFCSAILAVGVRSAAFISGGLDWNSISEKEYTGSSLFTMMKTPVYQIWTDQKTRKIAMFLLLNTSFMVVEFVYGFLSNSLGLISDACHMLFDCAALAIGLYASYISRLPPNSKFNFGYGRFEVLSGFANSVFLILVASLIVLESLERLLEPPEISTESLLVVSVGGLLVNVVGLIFFHEAHHHAHGSAPCTHVHHAHPDKVVPPPTPEWREEHAHISLPDVPDLPSSPKVVHSHGPTLSHDGRKNFPILHLLESSPKVNGYDGHQQCTSESHGTGFSFDDQHSRFPDWSGGGVKLVESHRVVPEKQFSHELSFSRTDFPLDAIQHGHGAEGASHVHDHKQNIDCSASQGPHFLADGHSHFNHQHHDHSGGHCQDPKHHVSPLQSPSHLSHQQTLSSSHKFEDQHGQHNQAPSDGTHENSGALSNNHQHNQHGHSDYHNQPFSPQSHSDGHQVVVHRAHHHDHGQSIHNTNASSHLSTKHQQDGMSSAPGEHDHGLREEHHQQHHHEEGRKEVSCSSHADQRDGHSRHHDGQPCSHDHKHHHEEDHGHRHGYDSHERGHHHDHNYGHNDNNFHRQDHEENQLHHNFEVHNHDHDHHHHHDHHHDREGQYGDHDHDGSHDEHSDHHHIDHNMEGIFLHILADTLGSVGVVISTLLIKYKGWLFTDPACSIFISVLIVSSVLPLVRNSAELLLQRVPRAAEKRIQKALRKVEEVDGVHDWHKLHVWSYSNTELVGTLRLHASIGTDKQLVHRQVTRILREAGIMDITLEVEDLEREDDQ